MATMYRSHAAGNSTRDQITLLDRGLSTTTDPTMRARMEQQKKKLESDLAAITPPPFESKAERDKALKELAGIEQAMVEGCSSLGIKPMPSTMAVEENTIGAARAVSRFQEDWGKWDVRDGKPVPAQVLPNGVGRYGAKFRRIDLKNRLAVTEGDFHEQEGQESFRPNKTAEPLMNRRRAVYGMPKMSDETVAELWPNGQPTVMGRILEKYEQEMAEQRKLAARQSALIASQQEALERLMGRVEAGAVGAEEVETEAAGTEAVAEPESEVEVEVEVEAEVETETETAEPNASPEPSSPQTAPPAPSSPAPSPRPRPNDGPIVVKGTAFPSEDAAWHYFRCSGKGGEPEMPYEEFRQLVAEARGKEAKG